MYFKFEITECKIAVVNVFYWVKRGIIEELKAYFSYINFQTIEICEFIHIRRNNLPREDRILNGLSYTWMLGVILLILGLVFRPKFQNWVLNLLYTEITWFSTIEWDRDNRDGIRSDMNLEFLIIKLSDQWFWLVLAIFYVCAINNVYLLTFNQMGL